MIENSLKKNFMWNIIGTTLNAFNSLFFLIIVTRICGVKQAGIFTFAFSTATLFNVIGVYSGRVYQVTDISNNSDKEYIVNKLITCIIMMIVSIIFVILNKYNMYKSAVIIILCVLKCFEAFCEVIYALFQKRDLLYKAGISLTLKSVVGLIVFFVVNIITKNILISSLFLLVSFMLIMVLYDYKNYKNIKINKKLNVNNVIKILKVGVFPFLVTFLCLFIINAAKYAIDLNLTDSDQTIYGIIIMPATVILLFGQFIIHPFLVKITEYISKNDRNSLSIIVIKFIVFILLFGLITTIGMFIFGIPILQSLYGIKLVKYKTSLLLIMIGASFYGIVSILSNIMIAMRHFKLQSVILFVISIFAFVLPYILTKDYGVYGASVSYFITMLGMSVIYVIMIIRYLYRMKGSEIYEKNKNVSCNS